ncbi:MAG: hypothetical protein VW102_04790 [Poseidonia sp.]
MAKLNRLVLFCISALFFDTVLRLMETVVVKINFLDDLADLVGYAVVLLGNGMPLLVGLFFGTLPTLSISMKKSMHVSLTVGHEKNQLLTLHKRFPYKS